MLRLLILAVIWTMQVPPDVIQRSLTGELAVIRMVRKTPKSGYEGILRLKGRAGKELCSVDHSSDDGNHGYLIEHSRWTTDGRFFVWSLSSSGGHQPWHTPTLFFDANTRKIRTLDDFVKGPGITNAEFDLVGADEIEVDVYSVQNAVKPSSIRLSLLRIAGNEHSKSWRCAGGATIRP